MTALQVFAGAIVVAILGYAFLNSVYQRDMQAERDRADEAERAARIEAARAEQARADAEKAERAALATPQVGTTGAVKFHVAADRRAES